MTPFDGRYRHRDALLVWDDAGLTFTRKGSGMAAHVAWRGIDGARQIGGRPGFVQLLVREHVPPADPEADPFSIAVAGDADANRLITSITWRAMPRRARRTRMGLRRLR